MVRFELKKMQQVVNAIPEKQFDSHRFINEFMKQYEADYIAMFTPQEGGFQKLNSKIGRYLLNHQDKLKIQKNDVGSSSINVKGNDSNNAVWNNLNVI